MSDTAVIIFAYCRFNELSNLLNSIKANEGYKNYNYYFFIDGPKNITHEILIEKVAKVVSEFSVPKKTVIKSKNNSGLAKSIISGVKKVSKKHDKFIVLEDDLILSENFLNFMSESLDHFQHNKDILNISGFNNLPFKNTLKNYYLSMRSTSWGWASWSAKWNNIDFENYKTVVFKDYFKLFIIAPDLPFMMLNQITGKIDSWAIRLVLHQARFNLFSATPINSYVINEGVGEHATNVSAIFQKNKLTGRAILKLEKIHLPQITVNAYKWFFEIYCIIWRKITIFMNSQK